jgi:N-acetylmuramoyl-L-alanine amidase
MATTHVVKQGEYLSQIAQKYGFRSETTIWNHPENATLRKKRGNGNILLPGDSIFIPDFTPKTAPAATTKKHVFVVPDPPLALRIRIHDFDDQPVRNTACELEVDGATRKLQTDGDGVVEAKIPRTAQQGKLTVPELGIEMPVKIGHLDPHDEDSGWRARLRNLGYVFEAGDAVGLQNALEEFQCDHKLKLTGKADSATLAQLEKLHGC